MKTLITKFGNPAASDAERLKFERTWMQLYDFPEEINKAIPALPNKVYCNKLIVAPLEKTLRELIAKGLHKEIRTWDGCFNIRKKRGLSSLSMHSWGLAIDMNATWNPLGGRVTWSNSFLDVWRRNGWECGADWTRRVDGQHFEWNRW